MSIFKSKVLYVVLISILIGLYSYFDIKSSRIANYRSLIVIKGNEFENITQRQTLDLLNMQEKDLSFYLRTHVLVNADNLFYTFYKNIGFFVGKDIHTYNARLAISPDYSKEEFFNSGIGFNNVSDGERIRPVMTKPNVKFIVMEYLDDGVWVPAINYNYLFEAYSNRLSKSWQEYLKLMAEEKSYQNNNFYYKKSKPTITKDKISKRIMKERKFIADNQNFVLNAKINENLELLVEDFLSDDDTTFEFDDKGRMVVRKSVIPVYESFLVSADKSSPEYKKVHNWYEMLKGYDFIRPVTGLTKLDTNNVIYKDVYLAPQLEEIKVFTARIKNIVKTKDIKMLADNVQYPICIEFSDGSIVNISDKSQLLKLEQDKIFTKELTSSILSSKSATPLVKGFSVGNSQEFTFDFAQDGVLKIYKIALGGAGKISKIVEIE